MSLTGGKTLAWQMGPGLEFHGSAQVITCRDERDLLGAELVQRLADEWNAVVVEHNFALAPLCSGSKRPTVQQRQRALLERFTRKAPAGLIRRLECRFGWVHLEDGQVVSGVS